MLIGLGSSGVHSNGFSLVRRVVERSGLSWDAPAPFAAGATLADALLTPTKLYVKSCLAATRTRKVKALHANKAVPLKLSKEEAAAEKERAQKIHDGVLEGAGSGAAAPLSATAGERGA